jgi:diacylglycerol kinase family enzyme
MPQAEAAIWNLSRRCLVFSRVRALLTPRRGAVRGEEMERFFPEAAAQKLDIFIVLGGDGTIRKATEACTERLTRFALVRSN